MPVYPLRPLYPTREAKRQTMDALKELRLMGLDGRPDADAYRATLLWYRQAAMGARRNNPGYKSGATFAAELGMSTRTFNRALARGREFLRRKGLLVPADDPPEQPSNGHSAGHVVKEHAY